MELNLKKRFYVAEILMIIGTLFLFAIFYRHLIISPVIMIIGMLMIFFGALLRYTKIKWYWLVILFFLLIIVIFMLMVLMNFYYRSQHLP